MNDRTLAERRQALGLTQRQVADALGYPYSTYVHWEQRVRKPPDYVAAELDRRFTRLEAKHSTKRRRP